MANLINHTRWSTIGLTVLITSSLVILTGLPIPLVGIATADEPAPAFVVEVQEDGAAEITLRVARDLDDEDKLIAFRTLETDQAARAEFRTRFENRLSQTASKSAEVTGRDMTVSNADLNLMRTPDNSTGVIEISVTWTGLAAVEDNRLVVTEPFASGFEPPQKLVIVGPDGYEVSQATPAPRSQSEQRVEWSSNSDLTGFELTYTPSEAEDDDTATSPGLPGFTTTTGIIAMMLLSLLAVRRVTE